MFLDYILKHWKELLIAALFLILWIDSRIDYNRYKDLEEQRTKAHEKSMEDLKINYEKRIEQEKQSFENYKKEIDGILEHYKESIDSIEIKTSERKNEYANILKEKPQTLIKEIEQKFGFSYVE